MSQDNREFPTEPQRTFSPLASRVLVLGLDGATWDVLGPMADDGLMPNLAKVLSGGAWGTLQSTIPPVTPAAWTTFLTGKLPGQHGILDFEGYDVNTGRLWLHSTQSMRRYNTIWRILSDQGFRVGSINVPLTYPPQPLNGFMITGFDTPGPQSDFAYPPELKSEVLSRWADPTCGKNWRRKSLGGLSLFEQNVRYMADSFHQGAAMTRYCGDKYGWDVLMAVFKLTDNVQHKTWKYLDPRWRDRHPAHRDIVRSCFAELDKAVGDLLDYADAHDAHVLLVSDHGHGSLEGKTYPNVLLKQWGYLKLHGPARRLKRAAQRAMANVGIPQTSLPGRESIEHHIPVDLSRTQACVMHSDNAAFLYINLQGRPAATGIVPRERYEPLRDELAQRFREVEAADASGREILLFPGVYKPEEIYRCTREDQPWLPDLILIPHETCSVVRKMPGRKPVRWLPYGRIEGTHRFGGIIAAHGAGIRPTGGIAADIVDCAPTLLAMLGLKIPEDMQGEVITSLFESPPRIEKASVTTDHAATADAGEQYYSEEELATITERLTDLGYLE